MDVIRPFTSRALPAGSVPSEVAECVGEPVVDVVQGELLVGGLHDGRPDQGRVRVWRPHVLHPVEFPVLGQVLLWVEVRVTTVMVGHPPAVTLSGKTGWVGRLLVQGASDIA